MPSAIEIRNGLVKAKQKRQKADALHAEGTDELRHWMQAAQEHPNLSMIEAARLAGFETRKGAYDLLKAGKKG